MIVYLNGHFVKEDQAVIPAFDRGFLYGDGLFETVRIRGGKPFLWDRHIARLQAGATALQISLPESPSGLREIAAQLLAVNHTEDCLLRITLSRGVGVRGYSPKGATHPTFMLSLHSLPERCEHLHQWRLITASMRAADPLARHKTMNKLLQVLMRMEADEAGANDALLLDPDGRIVECSSANIFWIRSGTVHTPPANGSLLPGVTRQAVLEFCAARPWRTEETDGTVEDLLKADGVFLTLTTLGIVEATHLDQSPLGRSQVTPQIHQAYKDMLESASRPG